MDGLEMEIRPQRGDRYTFYETLLRNSYLSQDSNCGPATR
jgi:hypothetical protein